jgi:hypothetical protein
MRILLSLIALFGAIAIADIAISPNANATTLAAGAHALQGQQAGMVEEARYTCWWRNGRRHCRWVGHRRGPRHCWWRNGRRVCRW